jgi:hypothetical protein
LATHFKASVDATPADGKVDGALFASLELLFCTSRFFAVGLALLQH